MLQIYKNISIYKPDSLRFNISLEEKAMDAKHFIRIG